MVLQSFIIPSQPIEFMLVCSEASCNKGCQLLSASSKIAKITLPHLQSGLVCCIFEGAKLGLVIFTHVQASTGRKLQSCMNSIVLNLKNVHFNIFRHSLSKTAKKINKTAKNGDFTKFHEKPRKAAKGFEVIRF